MALFLKKKLFTLHNFSQIIVICLSVKTGRSPLELLLITRLLLLLRLFCGELGPGCVEAAEATEAEAAAAVTVACRRAIPDVDARSLEAVERLSEAIIGSGEPGEAGGDLTEG